MQLSVIVTTYNRSDALAKVLDGLRVQTRPPDEVLVADDGSARETGRMVAGFKNACPYPLLHVWQEDRGFRAAEIRNKAIRQSGGDYIVCLDGDCIPNRHFIDDHHQMAEPGCFIQGKRILIGPSAADGFSHRDANSTARLVGLMLSGKIKNAHHILRLPSFPVARSIRLKGIKSCNMGFFRSDLFAVNGFNQDFVGWGREDSELAVRLFRYGLKRKSHPFMAICCHLWHPENDRQRLLANDDLLDQAKRITGYVCANGLVKK
jgi:glycosyltransferase involved in cell wall biosynthesis